MSNADAVSRLREFLRRTLQAARAGGSTNALVHRSDILEVLAGLLDEEEAVALAVWELETNWCVGPSDWVSTPDGTQFSGAWFTDAAGFRYLYGNLS